MNRGSARYVTGQRRVKLASMRPRFMNRGSVQGSGRAASRLARFNEAPIHESGKCAKCTWAAGRISRFNEAPIHESGKWNSPSGSARTPRPLQ